MTFLVNGRLVEKGDGKNGKDYTILQVTALKVLVRSTSDPKSNQFWLENATIEKYMKSDKAEDRYEYIAPVEGSAPKVEDKTPAPKAAPAATPAPAPVATSPLADKTAKAAAKAAKAVEFVHQHDNLLVPSFRAVTLHSIKCWRATKEGGEVEAVLPEKSIGYLYVMHNEVPTKKAGMWFKADADGVFEMPVNAEDVALIPAAVKKPKKAAAKKAAKPKKKSKK